MNKLVLSILSYFYNSDLERSNINKELFINKLFKFFLSATQVLIYKNYEDAKFFLVKPQLTIRDIYHDNNETLLKSLLKIIYINRDEVKDIINYLIFKSQEKKHLRYRFVIMKRGDFVSLYPCFDYPTSKDLGIKKPLIINRKNFDINDTFIVDKLEIN